MEYITLKNSDLRVSRVCIGGDPMGGHGWGETNENDLIEAVNEVLTTALIFLTLLMHMGLEELKKF